MKVAVVLFNLGGPDNIKAIEPFLFNFFRDKNIISLPLPLRWLLAKFISVTRSKGKAREVYQALGGCSPLLENTKSQARALGAVLKQDKACDFKVFVSMRHWHPMAGDVVQKVKAYKPDRIVLLPLYPQFSKTTTGSSLENWNREAKKVGLDIETRIVRSYPVEEGFIEASAKLVKEAYKKALEEAENKNPPRILFSAHGLPESLIKKGDPYQEQCEETAEAIVKKLAIPSLDWTICYQSRVGPKKWIGPSTEEELVRAGADKTPVIVYPHAFISEHVETLVEIEIEYRKKAASLGVPAFIRVPTVGTNDFFIKGLAAMINKEIGENKNRSGEDKE